MLLPLKFAFRYLISKKTTNAINVISGIAITGITVGSTILIIVLSVFNGFEGLVISLYNSFNPDLQVTPQEGKVFTINESQLKKIREIDGVAVVAENLTENALLKYKDKQFIGRIKGVDSFYHQISDVENSLIRGSYQLEGPKIDYAVIGAGVELALGVNIFDALAPILVYMPKRTTKATLNMAEAFKQKNVYPAGVFSIQKEFDDKYVIVPISFVRELLNYSTEVSALEIKISENADIENIQNDIRKIIGEDVKIYTRLEQNQFLYKIMKTEKFVAFCILSFILIIVAFSMVGSLSMLVIEKTKDISTLKVIGGGESLIMKIFLFQGLIMSFVGASIGAILAFFICWMQQNFKLLKLDGLFVVDAFPVEMEVEDFLLVFVTVMLIGLIASWIPARKAAVESKVVGI